MQRYFRIFRVAALLACVAFSTVHARDIAPLPPSQLYSELFHRAQTEKLFPDSKTFADATARASTEEIMRR